MAGVSSQKIQWTIPMLIAVLATLCTLAAGKTIYVNVDGQADFASIQAGIDAANDGDTVLVAPGEYVITEPITFRGKAITVKSGAGPDETTIRMGTPADTNRGSVVAFENGETIDSVLDGFTITGGAGSWLLSQSALVGGGIYFDASSGTVRNCAIVQNTTEHGGGVMCAHLCSPRLIACTIERNSAEVSVGGVFAWDGCSVTLTNCIISGNSSKDGGGIMSWENASVTMTDCIIRGNSATGVTVLVNGYGGGLYCGPRCLLTAINCNIAENSAGVGGGGVMCYQNSLATLTDCVITKNSAGVIGGGIECTEGSVTLTNCVITRNSSLSWGGGLSCHEPSSSVTVSNCSIWANSANQGGGGVGCYNGCSATVANSIVRGNTAPQGSDIFLEQGPTRFNVTYSNVTHRQASSHVGGGSTLNWGVGNIDADPCFAEPGYWADINDPNIMVEPDDPNAVWIDGDYHLKSEAGRWNPYDKNWIVDDVTSPCIDRGDPNSPVGDEPDPNGGIINMGAYGGTPEASMSIGQLPPLPPPTPLAHWRLDEIEGDIAYDSAGEYDGTLYGKPLWQPEGGIVAGAIELDGFDDYISVPFVLSPADGAFSVFAWIKGSAPGETIVSQEGGASWLMADPTDGALRTNLRTPEVTGRNAKPAGPPLICSTVVTNGDWHRVGFVRDGNNRILYVDDIEVVRDTAETLESESGGLYIGAASALDPGAFFSGLVDDVRIYNRAVSP